MVCDAFRKCHITELSCTKSNENCLSVTRESNPTVREKGTDYTIKNNNRLQTLKYRVDGGVISGNTRRCDYLILFRERELAYFVELKGQNWKSAIEQLKISFELLYPHLIEYTPNLRAVVKCDVPNTVITASSEYISTLKKVRQKNSLGTLKIGSRLKDEVE